MGRKTEWEEKSGGLYCGLGQRLLTTDQEDIPLLELRRVEFENDARETGETVESAAPPNFPKT